MLHGISMNTGGGATKIKNVGVGGLCYNKALGPPSPIFQLIQAECGESWEYMYESFNMGVGLDIVGEGNSIFAEALKRACYDSGISLYALVFVTINDDPEKNIVKLATPYGDFIY